MSLLQQQKQQQKQSFNLPTERPLSIAIVGAGSIGLYYGIKLAKADCDIRFLMRSGFEEAKTSGIRLEGPAGEVHLKQPKIFRNAEEMGPMDCILVTLKATSNSILEKILPPLLTSDSVIITLQNGLGNEEFLSRFVASHQIVGGICYGGYIRSSPASVSYNGYSNTFVGEFSEKTITPRVETLVTLLNQADSPAKAVVNLMEERWRKLVWNIPFNGLAVSEGCITTDKILSTPDLLTKCKNLMEEVILAANQLGYPIKSEYQNVQLERTSHMGPYRPSTLIDFEAGRKLEVEAIWGIPLRQAMSVGLKMPHLSQLYKRLSNLNIGLQ